MRERESYFNDFMLEVRRKEREEKSTAKEKVSLVTSSIGVVCQN